MPLEEVVELLRFAGRQRERELDERRLIESLSPREREVLQLLAAGLDSAVHRAPAPHLPAYAAQPRGEHPRQARGPFAVAGGGVRPAAWGGRSAPRAGGALALVLLPAPALIVPVRGVTDLVEALEP